MTRRVKPLKTLMEDQAQAADPFVHAAVSASAGTGKTQVLTARVLRLLLGGVRPETILCLTFTKAGAAEMANRISARLASWVRMKEPDLRKELFAIGEHDTPGKLDRARELFARVLDAPGGLRIQTIHSFAQTLLAGFPAESGLAPGFRPLEGRAASELARRTLADLVSDAEKRGDERLIADIQALSLRLGEGDAERYLVACAAHSDELVHLGPPDGVEPALRRAVGLPEGDIAEMVAEGCGDGSFDCALLRAIADANRDWGTDTGLGLAATIDDWLARPAAERAATLDALAAVFFTGKGDPRKTSSGQHKARPSYASDSGQLAAAIAELVMLGRASALVELQSAGLRAGMAFADAYARAKRAAGLVDFDDLIRHARILLETPGIGDWVRFKLDRRTDHVLVDEAQDTNRDQWAIVDALTDEFFSGSSEAEERWRTLFMVGDFKQAIFSFQGTNPREYEDMRQRVRARVEALSETAREDPDIAVTDFRDVPISASFRSAPAILDLVDAVIRDRGHEALGLPFRPESHRAFHADRPGRVEWWPAFDPGEVALEGDGEAGADEGWIGESDRLFASDLAERVRAMIAEAPPLASTGRPLSAGDILILVRSRAELASLIVARLFAAGVPVAGIDRLHLHRPLAVRDLLSAMAFAAQPLDDLNLAGLLVSPLVGWTQDDLFAHAHGRNGSLWGAILDHEGEGGAAREALAVLRPILAMADFALPSRFLETILSGPIQGRRKLLSRLGPEARDPIEELVSAAIEFERTESPSLERFLAWFRGGDVEIKRDPSAPADAVRVMTVHGAKGLEAPVVILADATADPAKLGPSNPPLDLPVGDGRIPVLRPRSAEAVSPYAELIAGARALDREEHWRLLYVALTRAEERLIVAGVRKNREAEDNWHSAVAQALSGLGAESLDDGRLVHRNEGQARSIRTRRASAPVALPLPDWIARPAPDEPVPPRPLAPSAIGEDDAPYPPPGPALAAAARRGVLLHRLFERLPAVGPSDREAAALGWLERSAGVADAAARRDLAQTACVIIGDPAYRDLFGPDSLAEAPIAATLDDGRVIAGTVDRLRVGDNAVEVIDFKTGLSVPSGADDVPPSHRRQMEAYREALHAIFPGREVRVSLLYTAGPKMIALTG